MAEFIRCNYVPDVIEYLQPLRNFKVRNKPLYKDIDAETEAPIFQSPDVKRRHAGKDPDARKE